MSKAKSAHYSESIAEHSGDRRSLWKAFNKILHRCPTVYLPDHSSIDANKFSSFFINKISIIRAPFSDSCSHVLNPPHSRRVLENLACVTEDEARHLIRLVPCRSSNVGPTSTSLVKDCIDILVTPVTSIVNLRLFPFTFQVFPCLPSIDKFYSR